MSSLLAPWRGARALKALAFVELNLLTSLIGFVLVVVLVALAVGTLPVFPLAVVVAWVASMVSAGLGRAERSRVAALLGTEIPSPHAPLSGSWWTRWKARVRSGSRWREVGYWASREPLGALSWTVVTALWGGSLALIALPTYVSSLPAGRAHFNLFTVTSGTGSALCCAAGVVGLVIVAPWVTVGVASRMEALAGPLRRAGVDVQFSGDWFSTGGLPSTEAIGIMAACIVLLLAFGSVIAMGLPIGTALLGLGVTVAEVALVSRFVTTPGFATQVSAMIGIGVGIDYALLIVTRYRDSLGRTHDPEGAVVEALGTAGRAVVFAGCTVVISLMAIYLMGLRYLDGLAVGASLGVAIAVLAAVTLLPALLGFVGPGIDRLRVKRPSNREGGGMWERWARFVQRRPLPLALGALSVLVVAAIPVFAIHLGFADAGNDAPSSTTRQAFDLVAAGFGPGANGPILVVADLRTPGATAALPRLAADLRSAPGVAAAAPVTSPSGRAAVITVTPTTGPQDQATIGLLHHLRDSVIPSAVSGTGMHVYVGGETAGNIDFAALMARRLPFFLIGVLTVSFLLLLVVFRSVLVPLKAVLMKLLSIGAAYGAMVAVFQWGWGGSHLGITGAPIEAWAPMMLFAIVFGLSMDYEVFLLSAIKEHYDATGDNGWSVASGLASTARVITAAATVMVVVFGSFLLSDARSLKEIGLGLALAIAVDATLVRVILVPATMELLGRANWWFPAWLERLVPRLRIDHGTDDVAADRPQVPASVS